VTRVAELNPPQPPIDQWVVLELGPKADGADPDEIRASIRHSIRDADVFIPASVTQMGEERVVQYLMEGYAFVRRSHADQIYLRLENTKFVNSVLRTTTRVNGSRPVRQIAFVTSGEIDKFRGQIREEVDQGICVGDLVLITSGPYRKIQARVEEEIPEQDAVQVYIKLRSKEAIITLPRACLRLVEKAPRSPYADQASGLRDWLRGARALLGWPKEEILRVLLPYETFVKLDTWVRVGKACFGFIQANEVVLDPEALAVKLRAFANLTSWVERGRPIGYILRPLDPAPLKAKAEEVVRLQAWADTGKKLRPIVYSSYTPPPLSPLESKYLEWSWFQDMVVRLEAVSSDVETIERSLKAGGDMMVQNVIIDGTQLAIRCLMAPGLNTLKDRQGRPTGAVLGFLQSLGGFHKRWPDATLHVTWDSSSQRRRKEFAEYKANRAERTPIAFETEWLREVLPMIGVHQAWHPEEEADDVIATLVHGSLKGQVNLVVTTDRDMLQLVSSTDRQFVPAVGAGKERVYDIDAVLQEYGVPPAEVTQVRALSGDTSDNIPGALGFGLKTASKLVKLYGSVDRIFASNLAGLTKAQYNNLKSAEKQVRLNVDLMRLHDDLHLTLVGPDPNQIAVRERLHDVDIKPDGILANFFANAAG